jgi:hypothetical protein
MWHKKRARAQSASRLSRIIILRVGRVSRESFEPRLGLVVVGQYRHQVDRDEKGSRSEQLHHRDQAPILLRSSITTCTLPVELVTMKAENELELKEEASRIDERVLSA